MSRRNYGWGKHGPKWPSLARARSPWLARFTSYGARNPIRSTKRKTR